MTEVEAKKIGSRQGLIFVIVGLLIAQFIMVWFSSDNSIIEGFFWFTTFNYNFNVIIGILIMLISGHLFGQIAGKAILIKKRNYVLMGFLCGMAILMTTAFLSSWIGFFQEGISKIGTEDNPFVDYIYKPIFWILFFGLIPVLVVGTWFGKQIKKHENK